MQMVRVPLYYTHTHRHMNITYTDRYIECNRINKSVLILRVSAKDAYCFGIKTKLYVRVKKITY